MIERNAFAKLNLDLRVLGTRADGYHELRTVFQTIALNDVLRIERIGDDEPFEVACEEPGVPAGPANIVWRAAARLWQSAGRDRNPRGARVHLHKRIPAMGGLGGGSADAAVALVALAEVWDMRLSREAFASHAAALGADVPFFLLGGTAQASGRGDVLRAWPDLPALEVVLVSPSFGVQTVDAYRWFDQGHARIALNGSGDVTGPEGPTPDARGPEPAPDAHVSEPSGFRRGESTHPSDWRDWLTSCRNDLQPAVAARYPVIDDLCLALSDAGAVLARMSGSGSTVFGLFDDGVMADRAAHELHGRRFAVERTRTLNRVAYLEQAFGPWLRAPSEEPREPRTF